MREWFGAAAVMFGIFTSVEGHAQHTPAQPGETVLFVCEHGTVKSLLAKLLFDEYARSVGLDMTATSRGTLADSLVPPWMKSVLASDRLAIGTFSPQTLLPGDLSRASMVVSFDIPSAATDAARVPRAQWNGLPSVSRDYPNGRDAIKARVRQLVDSLKRARTPR